MKVIMKLNTNNKFGLSQISVSDLPNGIYIITTENFGSKNSVKITVNH